MKNRFEKKVKEFGYANIDSFMKKFYKGLDFVCISLSLLTKLIQYRTNKYEKEEW